MALDPWSYAEKTGREHAHQTALFMWANMACRYGLTAAEDPLAYKVQGRAQQCLDRYGGVISQLKWLHAIHNQGHGDAIRGGKAKAEGVKAGVSDLFLPVPMIETSTAGSFSCAGKYRIPGQAGLYLELKVGSNTPSEIQLEFMADMRAAGYAADWAIGWLEARQKILAYLQINC